MSILKLIFLFLLAIKIVSKKMPIITLTTDYGIKDHFVGALKGKIISEMPEANIVDISHYIDPFNIFEAAYILESAWNSFPKGTIHLIGVDMELNLENQHIVMQWNDHFFIAADNGILSLLCQKFIPQKIVSINVHDRFTDKVSDIDVLVRVATHIAKGGLMHIIGTEIKQIKEVTTLKPMVTDNKNTLKGYVIYIDHFGNVVVNITKKMFEEVRQNRDFEIILNEKYKNQRKNNIKTIHQKYSDIGLKGTYALKNYEGEKLAVFNEAGYLEIAIFRSNPATVGSAKTLLGLQYRDLISIEFQ